MSQDTLMYSMVIRGPFLDGLCTLCVLKHIIRGKRHILLLYMASDVWIVNIRIVLRSISFVLSLRMHIF